MRITFAVIAALFVGAVLGAAATHELQAQIKPPVYVVTETGVGYRLKMLDEIPLAQPPGNVATP